MSCPLNASLWQHLSQTFTAEMQVWRQAHPRATLRDIEDALDRQLAAARVRMVEDLAHTSTAVTWTPTADDPLPCCSHCTHPLHAAGPKPRTLQTYGGHTLTLERSHAVCPACGTGLFPPR